MTFHITLLRVLAFEKDTMRDPFKPMDGISDGQLSGIGRNVLSVSSSCNLLISPIRSSRLHEDPC